MKTFIIMRLADIITTYLNVHKWGWDVEGNGWMRKIGESGMFLPYQIIVTLFTIWVLNRYKHGKFVYIALSVISGLVAISNLFCYIFIN